MKAIHETSQFRKDIKKLKKQRKAIEKLKEVISLLAKGDQLEPKHRDHPLIGPWSGSRDCHIEPDWIVIYRPDNSELFLERTGSHSEIFRE